MDWRDPGATLPRSRYLMEAELRRILGAVEKVTRPEARSKFRVLFLILVNLGPRISEALAVRAADVDLEGGTITFPTLKRRRPMSRTLPLPAAVARELEVYLHVQGLGPDDRLFPRTRGKYVWEVFKRCLHEVRLPRQYRLHDLRHSAGTYLADKTRDPMLVRDVLGHASLTTSNIYLHTVQLREKLQAVPPILPAMPGPPAPAPRETPGRVTPTGKAPGPGDRTGE